MTRLAAVLLLLASPALADGMPKSEVGTAFVARCLEDVIDHRIAALKRQAPDYAATLTDEELRAGASHKAEQVCPCFLQVVATAPDVPGSGPEERVARILEHLEAETKPPMLPVIGRMARMCGQRSSTVPSHWLGP